MKRRILSMIFVFLFVFSAFTFTGSAADVQLVSEDIGKTDVVTDLKKMGYDLSTYKKNVTADYIRLIHFQEWGYRYDGNTSEHALYLYVFNPSGKAINENSYKNAVQLDAVKGSGEKYGAVKYKMDLVSISDDQGWENMFLKFKVKAEFEFVQFLDQGMRRYELSGIELHHTGDVNATDYKIGNVYGCSGFMPYRGANNSPTNTLTTAVTDLLTIDLDLHGTSWHTLTSNKGDGYRYEVFSVYFAVPDDIIEKYGDENNFTKGLNKVEGTFEEYKVNGLLTSSQEVLTEMPNWISHKDTMYGNQIPYFFVTSKNDESYAYNLHWYDGIDSFCDEAHRIHYLTSLFDVENKNNFEGYSYDETEKVFEAFWDQMGYPLYLPYVDEGAKAGKQPYTVEAGKDLADKIATYASLGHGWLYNFFNDNLGLQIDDEHYKNIQSLCPVTSSDVSSSFQDSYISDQLFIDEDEVSELREYVSAANEADKTVFLMRFAVRDFFFKDAKIYENKRSSHWEWDAVSGDHYYFEKTIFRNFDVLSTTWKDQYNQPRIIPVVCSPIEVLGSIAPPQEGSNWDALKNFFQGIIPGGAGSGWGDDDKSFDWIKGLKEAANKYANWLVVIGGLLLLALVLWIFGKFKWVLAPFKALGKGIKKISKGAKDRRKKRKEKRKQKKKEKEKQTEEKKKKNEN